MAPKFDVGAEIDRLTAKSEMYFSIIQETYDISLQITTNTASKLKFLEKLHLIENAREQCIKLSDEINKLRYLEDPSFVPEYADMRALEILYGKIKHIEKMLDNQNISNSPIPDSVPNHHLPSIEVPKFSGNIQQWPLFYETFRALIHENTRLDNVSKFHFLKGALEGSVLKIFNSILPTADNYPILWEALLKKYQNKRYLATTYFKQLLSFKTITSSQIDLFLEQFDTAVQALSQLNLQDAFDFMIMSMAFSKLDPGLQEKFEHSYQGEFPKYQDLLKFLHKSQQAKNQVYCMTSMTNNYTYDKPNDKNTTSRLSSFMKYDYKCLVCREKHRTFTCSKFLAMNIPDRRAIIQKLHLCVNCLSHKTTVACRSNRTCLICEEPHHTLLHIDKNLANTNQGNPSNFKSNNTVLCTTSNNKLAHNTTILPTAVTKVSTKKKNTPLRTIIDSASDKNFVTLAWCRKAHLKVQPFSAKVIGLGNSSQNVIGLVNFTLKSTINPHQLPVCAYVVQEIVRKQPQTTIPVSSIQSFLKYPLADPKFYVPQTVDGILGCDVFSEVMGTNKVKSGQGLPIALETRLGYIIMGSISNLLQPSSTFTQYY
ncbi:uncharacterized protein LOC113388038 [Ctenocephalides felis]|uniref:uncharacterized protein LOC113388038 n=1 Tax=Ctenocephalides felis TaxID=7515 RepID=UPI000E6E41DF|nr:uncharacterized protein LOC113388038 [Ctenocephalides felis]